MEVLREIGRRCYEHFSLKLRIPWRKSYIVLVAGFGFVAGIIAHSFIDFNFSFFWIYNALLLSGVLILIFWKDPTPPRLRGASKKIRLIFVGVFFIIAGFARFNLGIEENKILPEFYEKEIKIIGIVADEPINKIDKQQLIIKPEHIGRDEFIGREQILLTTSLYPQYEYGDGLEINCKLQKPKIFEDFDYARYLSMQNIYGVCYWPAITQINADKRGAMSALLRVKSSLIAKINQNIHEPLASFLAGLTVGARNAIPPKLLDNFQRTGTTHIIAISGWNISFLGAMFLPVLFALGLRRKSAFYVMLVLIFLFVIFVGAGASVIRAGIMGSLALYALAYGRYNNAGRALLYSICLMFLINSHIIYDAGFWLSVSATFGLIYFPPIVEKYLQIKIKFLRETLIPTTSAVIFTLPISSFVFGHISLWSLPVNILILPFVAYAIIFALPVLPFLIFIPQNIAQILFLPSVAILNFIIKVINLFGNLPFGYLPLKINFFVMLAFYVGLLYFTFWKLKQYEE
ncbi:ComEC family competence protein [Patescibacteria group bacterium]|nr:ComEC family competence protein [Patescibacteria group bacterium]